MRIIKLIEELLSWSNTNFFFTNLQGNVWEQEGRIDNQILGVNGLRANKL